MLYRIIRAFVRLAVHLFFRRIDVESPQNVPAVGPILFVANHTNALVDPLVIISSVRRPVTLTAKRALADNVFLRWLMRVCGVVTFQRQQDVGPETSRRENITSLRQCLNILARGGAICIFPEGVSHSDSKLRPFRNGAARIAIQYARDSGSRARLRIVPVGLLYTAKDRFRSDVWLRFGDPVDVQRWCEENPDAVPADLTKSIEHRVAALTINTPSRREQYLLTWAAKIVSTRASAPASIGSDETSVAEWFRLVGRLLAGWQWLNQHAPDVPRKLSARIRAYRRKLRRAGISPSEVFISLNVGRAAFFLLRELELMIIGGPIALFGAINHAAPYFTVKSIAMKLSRDKDQWASNAIYPSLVVFPLFYALQLAVAWLFLPRFWSAIYTVVLPYTGYYAVLYGDRFQRAWRRARTFVRFTRHPDEQELLAEEGRDIIQEIAALSEVIEGEQCAQAEAISTSGNDAFEVSASDLEQRFDDDIATLRDVRDGLARLETVWQDSRQMIAVRQRGFFTPEEDDQVRQMILAYRNYRLVLYEIIHRYSEHHDLTKVEHERRAFMIAYAAALTTFTKSMLLIRAYEHEPLVRQKLNEADARFDLPAGFFEEILRMYTSLVNYRRLAACNASWARHRRAMRAEQHDHHADDAWLANVIQSERKATRRSLPDLIAHRLRWDYRTLLRSAYSPVYRARYALRSFIGGTLGNVRFGPYRPAINSEILASLSGRLRPGDVILMRAEQKITTALLPGFWCHAALYIGKREDLDALELKSQPAVERQWSRMVAEELPHGCVIEAVAPKVVIRSLEKALQVDHVAVLRPRLGQEQMKIAIADALAHADKPYDFEFDFNVSTRLVCTELIYRIYNGRGPVSFELTKRVGRFTLSCDDIANTFVAQASGNVANAPFELVALALRAADGRARFIDNGEAFRRLVGLAQRPPADHASSWP